MDKRPEDMNRAEREQHIAEWKKWREEGKSRVPLLSQQQSDACRLTNEAEILRELGERERRRQERFRKWIAEGGKFPEILEPLDPE